MKSSATTKPSSKLGASIADPAAEELKSGALPEEAVDWLKTNFFKAEFELGH